MPLFVQIEKYRGCQREGTHGEAILLILVRLYVSLELYSLAVIVPIVSPPPSHCSFPILDDVFHATRSGSLRQFQQAGIPAPVVHIHDKPDG